MLYRCTGGTTESYWSYGTNLFYHLAADAAGLARGQAAVVSGSPHLELVHSSTGLGDIDLVALVRRSVSPFRQIIGYREDHLTRKRKSIRKF